MQQEQLKPVFIKELKKYSENFFKEKNIGINVLNQLRQYDYVKYEDGFYKFKYVGVILIENIVLWCYPKYLPELNDSKKFKQIIQVIRKYNKTEDADYEYIESNQRTSNFLPLMLFFLEDYYENGIYTKQKTINQTNGNGEIDWDKTINNYNPVIIKNKPYYMELETKYNTEDTYNIFRQLHKCILTLCSQKLENTGLIDLFELTPINLSDKKLQYFHSQNILKKIEQELNIEYNTHKRKLLHYMYDFIKEENTFGENENISLYGTNAFHMVWEKVCQKVLGDKLEKKISELNEENLLPNKIDNINGEDKKLINLIDKPEWTFNNIGLVELEKEKQEQIKKNTLKPDLILLYEKNFIVLDAKYYVYKLDRNKLSKQPGVESITKQYLYELAYKEFIEKAGFTNSKNGLLFPSDKNKVENVGTVKIEFLSKLVKEYNKTFNDEEDIQLIKLPAEKMYEKYLNKEKLEISKLKIY